MLQNEQYERARLSRDPRFDGHFYIGVKTTGIYCRPVCPANAPKSSNVVFYPSAAAAAEAGYRPCLRCRPECAPGTPAWVGTSTTVRRGLRLISSGALDDGDIEDLAERLGVTGRHLRRLFGKHVGASPVMIAHTQRLHFAKRLIDETDLPMSLISSAAGYGSVRRFNDTFRNTYDRAPRDLRKLSAHNRRLAKSAALTVRLAYRQPFRWATMCKFFAARAIPGVEAVVGNAYLRTISLDGQHGIIEVRPDDQDGFLSLSIIGVDTSALFQVVQQARDMFDLDAPVGEICSALGRDKLLERHIAVNPGIRVPGAWNGFELCVRAILGQQISVSAATTLAGRIAARYGLPLGLNVPSGQGLLQYVFPTAERLMRARLNNIGLVRSRAATIRSVAAATAGGDLNFDPAQDPEEFCRHFQQIKGIGDWTAQYVAMRILKSPDAFPAADLGLLKALGNTPRAKPAELIRRAEDWRPWRAYAALLLWNSPEGSGG